MKGRGKKTQAEDLRRVIESNYAAIPSTVRKAYDRDELVNGVWLLMRSRNVTTVNRIRVRMAGIDFHRSQTRYRGSFTRSSGKVQRQRHGDVIPTDKVPQQEQSAGVSMRMEIVEELREVRRRLGSDGLIVFVLRRVMDLDPRSVTEIMGWEPNSLLAKSAQDVEGGSVGSS